MEACIATSCQQLKIIHKRNKFHTTKTTQKREFKYMETQTLLDILGIKMERRLVLLTCTTYLARLLTKPKNKREKQHMHY